MPEGLYDIINHAPLLLQGLGITLLLAISVIVVSLLLGTLLGISKHEGPTWLRRQATLYVEFIRSIPLILFLVFVHYGVMPLVMEHPNYLISSFIAFSLFEAAYIAEIVRGGLNSIIQEERDSAVSLGLTYSQQMIHVYLPLAYRRILPALISQFVSLLKDTSLASIVGVIELTRAGEIIYEQTFHDLEILLFLALVYFLMCYGLSRFSRRFEIQTFHEENLYLKSIQG